MAKADKKKLEIAEQTEERQTTHTIILGTPNKALLQHLENEQNRQVIRKAKIVGGRRLDVSFTTKTGNGTDTDNKKCSAPVHPDLKKAFAELNNHLGRLCFQPLTEHNPAHKDNKELPALICPIFCTGFSISGDEDTEAVVLHGYRRLPNAKEIDLVSPSQRYRDDIFEYEESGELSEAIMACVGEVELYLFPSAEWPDCKTEPDNQLSLFPDEKDEEQETI